MVRSSPVKTRGRMMELEERHKKPAPVARCSSQVTRKVQPGIKDRAEAFLANVSASAATESAAHPQSSNPRKRKIVDLLGPRSEDGGGETEVAKLIAKPYGLNSSLVQECGEKKKKVVKKDEEKRQRLFRKKPPRTFLEKLSRAQNQRMIVVGRTRSDGEAFPREEIDIVGSTGNIYKVTIGQVPSCTCPDHRKGNECKHKVYALHTVLKAPEHLQYQLAYLSSELREIFAGAPPIPTDSTSSGDTDGKRKPVEGECPICYMNLDEEENELVWCKAACGNNMHQSCFDQWAASQRGAIVKCVYCRTPWQVDPGDLKKLTQTASVNPDGYVNVAEQFGMSRARDYSTYHQPWVRRQFGMGW